MYGRYPFWPVAIAFQDPHLADSVRLPMSASGPKPPLLFRAKLGHMGGRLGPLHANDEGRKHRFRWAKAAYKDSRRGSNPYPYFWRPGHKSMLNLFRLHPLNFSKKT